MKQHSMKKLLFKNIFFLTAFILWQHQIANAQVQSEWVSRFNGPGNSVDEAKALALDAAGNCYVTGVSYSNGTLNDYTTIKYNSWGNQLWVARFNGSGNSVDYATSLITDYKNNAYVTGGSYNNEANYDYVTVKYNDSGAIQWVAIYNGPGNSNDIANAIAIDTAGNIYVTGKSYGNGTFYDYATIKYDSAGTEIWVARYNGLANGSDNASAIAIDKAGNIYVTGWCFGNNSDTYYATLKYDSYGNEQWTVLNYVSLRSGDEASSIALDDSGNIYVTVEIIELGLGYNYATIKYSPSGIQQWKSTYNGPGNHTDLAKSISLDTSGNIFVTGKSVGSGTWYDFATIKYNNSGNQQWVARYNGLGDSWDGASSITLDNSGNIYVTGTSEELELNYDYVTIKYNPEGIQQWIERYNGPGNNLDNACSIVSDNVGNIYMTGKSYGNGTNYDYATIKYSQGYIPLELSSFIAAINCNSVALTWSTATETNNSGFEILRGVYPAKSGTQNENEWNTIGFVPGFGTTTEPKSYSFIDENVSNGVYKYRLEQIDFDGSFTNSNEIEVVVDFTPKEFVLYQNYPNPFNPSTTIKFEIPGQARNDNVMVTLKVYDILGNEVATLVNEEKQPGVYEVEFSVGQDSSPEIASGIYFYQIRAGSFSNTKKMILTK
jgi:uncharacterized delta-60 repeat protein